MSPYKRVRIIEPQEISVFDIIEDLPKEPETCVQGCGIKLIERYHDCGCVYFMYPLHSSLCSVKMGICQQYVTNVKKIGYGYLCPSHGIPGVPAFVVG